MTATAANVRIITGLGDPPDDTSIDVFIETAGFLTAQCDFPSTEQADRCQEYLASHLLAASPVGKAALAIHREKIEDVYDVTYANAVKSATTADLTSSEYGLTANMLSNGCLIELGMQSAQLFVIGGC